MISRKAKDTLLRLCAQFPVVGITGPRQSGKTTLARLIAEQTESDFVELSAVTSGVKDIKEVVDDVEDLTETLCCFQCLKYL